MVRDPEAVVLAWHEHLPSTMDEAHRLAASGAVHGTAVVARTQGAGRGRRGRTWVSPEGGLWMSVVCRPADGESVGCLSLRVGLAVAEALEARFPELGSVELKWPNDLVLQGRKLAGILCEARWDGARPTHVVVGLGLNVVNPIPESLSGGAIRLADVAGPVSPDVLAEPLADAIARAGGTRGPLTPGELAAWARRDSLAGRTIVAGALVGTGAGVTPDGALLLRQASGAEIRVDAGEVSVRRAEG